MPTPRPVFRTPIGRLARIYALPVRLDRWREPSLYLQLSQVLLDRRPPKRIQPKADPTFENLIPAPRHQNPIQNP
jgi:hypothetical protein